MSTTDQNSQPQTPIHHSARKPALDNRELKKTGFWLNQVFIVASTIIGVYLAAQSGLEQALKFDSYSKKEDNYYLRSSVADELEDNVAQLEDYAQQILLKSPPLQIIKNQRPNTDLYVWEAMKFNPATLETPTELLSGVRRFYSRSERIMNHASKRVLSSREAGLALQQEIDQVKQTILPKLRKSADQLKQELAKEGVKIGSLRDE